MPQLKLRIRPIGEGEDSGIALLGALDTCLASEFAPALFRLLADWSGSAVRVVLPVDHPLPDWFELWTDAFDGVAPADFEVEFVLDRDIAAVEVAP